MKKVLKYILIGFIGLVVLGAIIGSSGSSDKTETKSTGTDTTESTPQAQITQKVEMTAFVKEFDENQLAAEEKYKGRLVEFNGYVKNISEDILGSPFLAINPNTDQYYYGTYIQCFFKEKSELTSLKNGQRVTAQGKVDSQTLGNIVLKECKVVNQ